MAKHIYNEGGFGLNGLNRGLTATFGRHGIWNMFYFGFYHNVKVYIPKTNVCT
jgi:solute carrier family 25 2-oxodicarboxylate transporter 21